MKLLEQYQSYFDAENTALQLRNIGILTRVSDKYSNTHSFVSGAFKVGLWVVLDEQYEDAVACLMDDNHEVKHPLTEDQMLAIENAGALESRQLFDRALIVIAGGLAALIVLGVVVHRVLS